MEPTNNTFEHHLSRFTVIGLSDLGKEHLQDRVDTKFALHQSAVTDVLHHLEKTHRVLAVAGLGTQPYRNLYFDDDRLSFYFHHHDKKGNRCKVRLREYSSSNTIFFEVKQKINKNRTVKQRIPHETLSEVLSAEAINLLREFVSTDVGTMQPTLWCDFNRITLLSPDQDERLTIDYNICVRNKEAVKTFPGLALIEVKHASNRPSSFNTFAKQHKIRKMSVSKYCLGIAQLHPGLKQNNFRMKLVAIEKIILQNEVQNGI